MVPTSNHAAAAAFFPRVLKVRAVRWQHSRARHCNESHLSGVSVSGTAAPFAAWTAQPHDAARVPHWLCQTSKLSPRSAACAACPEIACLRRVRKLHVCGHVGKELSRSVCPKNTMFRANPNVQISSLIENVPFPMRSNSCQLQKTIAQQHITIHYSRTSIYTS